MLSTIIIGFDGSDRAQDALALGRTLSDAFESRLIVAYHPASLVELRGSDICEQTNPEAEGVLAHARTLLGERAAEYLLIDGSSPSWGLYRLAVEEKADLLVLGSCRRGAIGRVVLGSVGERLIHGAPCAISVAPHGYGHDANAQLGNVGVGYVDEPEGHAALHFAHELAQRTGSHLEVISGLSFMPAAAGAGIGGYGAGDVFQARHQAAEKVLARAVEEIGDDVAVTSRLIEGEPPRALIERSKDLDLLILGSRGYGPIHYVLVGSVSEHLMRKAACPVLVIPRSVVDAARSVDNFLTVGA
jgi:nucleotide-binding universal stress UspA family protein